MSSRDSGCCFVCEKVVDGLRFPAEQLAKKRIDAGEEAIASSAIHAKHEVRHELRMPAIDLGGDLLILTDHLAADLECPPRRSSSPRGIPPKRNALPLAASQSAYP
ncbi:MAG: hypothetical protein ACRDLT_13010 [Solirubrobacteraceae bacterium]